MAVKKSKTGAVKKSAKPVRKSAKPVKKSAKPARKSAGVVKYNSSGIMHSAGVDENSAAGIMHSADIVRGPSFDLLMEEIITRVGEDMRVFMQQNHIQINLTPKERARLISAGIRNYGFIEKTRDVGRDNPSFLPPHFDIAKFTETLHDFDIVRQLYLVVEKFESIIWDSMLIKSNALYRDSLRVYNGLKEQAKGQVPGASDLFKALEPYFKRGKLVERQPSQKEEIRKIKSLIKGKSDGEILVRNIKPKTSGGVHEVLEDIGKERIEGKEIKRFGE